MKILSTKKRSETNWQEVQKQLLIVASKRSLREKIIVWPKWSNILERVLGIPSKEILQRFESVGLKYRGIEELLAPSLHATEAATFGFESWRDAKTGLVFSTTTIGNLLDPHTQERTYKTHNTAGPFTSRLFNDEIRDFVRTTMNRLVAKDAELTEADVQRREEELSGAGFNRNLLLGEIRFSNDGSVSILAYDDIGATVDPKYAYEEHESLVHLPIAEMRILAATGDPLLPQRLAKRDVSKFYNLLTGKSRAVTALDVLKPRLAELGLELKPEEDEWGVYGRGDSFHSKYGTITYEHELFYDQEDLWVMNERPARQIIKDMAALPDEMHP